VVHVVPIVAVVYDVVERNEREEQRHGRYQACLAKAYQHSWIDFAHATVPRSFRREFVDRYILESGIRLQISDNAKCAQGPILSSIVDAQTPVAYG
jgi:hypothetical protein